MQEKGVAVEPVNKVREGRPHIVDKMTDGSIALLLNTTEGAQSISDSYSIRRTALVEKIPYSTTISGGKALVKAIAAIKEKGGLQVAPLQEYFG